MFLRFRYLGSSHVTSVSSLRSLNVSTFLKSVLFRFCTFPFPWHWERVIMDYWSSRYVIFRQLAIDFMCKNISGILGWKKMQTYSQLTSLSAQDVTYRNSLSTCIPTLLITLSKGDTNYLDIYKALQDSFCTQFEFSLPHFHPSVSTWTNFTFVMRILQIPSWFTYCLMRYQKLKHYFRRRKVTSVPHSENNFLTRKAMHILLISYI